METGDKIKRLRELSSLSREQLGCLVGVTRRAISYYEHNERFPDLDVILKIANIFGVVPVELLPDWFIENEKRVYETP